MVGLNLFKTKPSFTFHACYLISLDNEVAYCSQNELIARYTIRNLKLNLSFFSLSLSLSIQYNIIRFNIDRSPFRIDCLTTVFIELLLSSFFIYFFNHLKRKNIGTEVLEFNIIAILTFKKLPANYM